jgi:hypothetical protein
MDTDRIQEMIDAVADAGLSETSLTPADLVTNEYIDTSIGL